MLSKLKLKVILFDFGMSSAWWFVFTYIATYIYSITKNLYYLSLLLGLKSIIANLIILSLLFICKKLNQKLILKSLYIFSMISTFLILIFRNNLSVSQIVFIVILFEITYVSHNIFKYNIKDRTNNDYNLLNILYELSYSIFIIFGSLYTLFAYSVDNEILILASILILVSLMSLNKLNMHVFSNKNNNIISMRNHHIGILLLLLFADLIIAFGDTLVNISLIDLSNTYIFNNDLGFPFSLLLFGSGSLLASFLLIPFWQKLQRIEILSLVYIFYAIYPINLMMVMSPIQISALVFYISTFLAGFTNSFLTVFFTSLYRNLNRTRFSINFGIANLVISIGNALAALIYGIHLTRLSVYNLLLISFVAYFFALPIMKTLFQKFYEIKLEMEYFELKEFDQKEI